MAEMHKRIARILTCEDGRLHLPEAQHIAQLCALLEVDICYVGTEAGPDGAILHDDVRRPGAFKNASIIKGAKNPDVFAIVAHYECAGHPVSDDQHDVDVVKAAEHLSLELFGEPNMVVPLIAYPNASEDGPTWLIKRIEAVSMAV